MPLEPSLLDYENTQFLLIGESRGIDNALQAQDGDEKKEDRETPHEEMEKLEHEDEIRVQHLKGRCSFLNWDESLVRSVRLIRSRCRCYIRRPRIEREKVSKDADDVVGTLP